MSLRPKVASLEEDMAAFQAGRLKSSSTRVLRVAKDEPEPILGQAVPAAAPSAADGAEGGEAVDGPLFRGRRVHFSLPEDDDAAARLDAADAGTSVGGMLRAVQEREERRDMAAMFLPKQPAQPTGFPESFDIVFKEGESAAATPQEARSSSGGPAGETRPKKMSLFKQRMLERKGGAASASAVAKSAEPRAPQATASATAVSSTSQADVSEENAATVAGMSAQEIRTAQDEIRAMFDPAVLESFQQKFGGGGGGGGGGVATAAATATMPDLPQVVAQDEEEPSSLNVTQDLSWIKTEADLDKAVAMLPKFERDKLRWTGRVNDDEEAAGGSSLKGRSAQGIAQFLSNEYRPSAEEARFGFDGEWLSAEASEALPASSGLFHHGEDPDKGGYSVQELVGLARSTAPAQATLALNVLGNILSKRQAALYESPAKHPLFSLPRELPLTLRVAIDSGNPGVVTAGLRALEAFLVPRAFQRELVDALAHGGKAGLCVPEHVPRAQGATLVYGPALDEGEQAISKAAAAQPAGEQESDVDRIEASPTSGLCATGLVARISFILGGDHRAGVPLGPGGLAACFRLLAHVVLHAAEAARALSEEQPRLVQAVAERVCAADVPADAAEPGLLFLTALAAQGKATTALVAGQADGALIRAALDARGDRACVAAVALSRVLEHFGISLASLQPELWRNAQDGPPGRAALLMPILAIHADGVPGAETLAEDALGAEQLRRQAPRALSLGAYVEQLARRLGDGPGATDTGAAALSMVWERPVSTEVPPARASASPALDRLCSLLASALERGLAASDEAEVTATLYAVLPACEQLAHSEASRRALVDRLDGGSAIRARLEAWLQAGRGPGPLSASDRASPGRLCAARAQTLARLSAVRLLARLFGTTLAAPGTRERTVAHRRKVLCACMPSEPHRLGLREEALAITLALFAPALGLAPTDAVGAQLAAAFQDALGLGQAAPRAASLRIGASRTEASGPAATRLALMWRRKWEAARSAWSVLPMHAAPTSEQAPLAEAALEATEALLSNGAIEPADLVLALAHLLKEEESECFFQSKVLGLLNRLVDTALRQLFADGAWFEALQRAAGGRTALISLWKGLLVAFNERLNGQETSAALLLLMFRMDADTELRGLLWFDLHGANLLRLVAPPESAAIPSLEHPESAFTVPAESDHETLQCMVQALCMRTVTEAGNPFLWRTTTSNLAGHLWGGPLTWNRKRLLRQLLVHQAFWAVVTTNADGSVCEKAGKRALHAQALKAVRIVAREDPGVWKLLRKEWSSSIDLTGE